MPLGQDQASISNEHQGVSPPEDPRGLPPVAPTHSPSLLVRETLDEPTLEHRYRALPRTHTAPEQGFRRDTKPALAPCRGPWNTEGPGETSRA